MNAGSWKRLGKMDWGDRALLAEACLALAVGSAAIALLPFRRLAARLARGDSRRAWSALDPQRTISRCRWAIETTSRRLPWRTVCFQKGLAMHWMLRRRGVASRLHYGVSSQPDRGLAAHVWLTVGDQAVIGGETAGGYRCLATYPSEEDIGGPT